MLQNFTFRLIFILLMTFHFNLSAQNQNIKEAKVLIKTQYGNMIIRLYDETPLHRDNFLKLTRQGIFDSLLFHRCIKGFMIQGGDPQSKHAIKGKQLGEGDLGYTIPSEIRPELIHKKGVLAAARTGDLENPERRSSASQFYIVQGVITKPEQIRILEDKIIRRAADGIFRQNVYEKTDSLALFKKQKNKDAFETLVRRLQNESMKVATEKNIPLTKQQLQAYTTVGGTPQLDGAYTVFGEVLDGISVVDSIAAQKTDSHDRPLQDIRMKIELLP